MEDLWIRNGKITTSNISFVGDIIVSEGKIEKVGVGLSHPNKEFIEIDATGKYVIPGGIDPHVHLELPTRAGPSSDDFYSGSLAALMGGTTSIIDFVTPNRSQSMVEALSLRKLQAQKSLIDYCFHIGISSWNDSTSEEMKHCFYNEGITSFKTYLAYRDTIGIDYQELSKVLKIGNKLNAVICVHCEEGLLINENQKNFISQGKISPLYHALSRPTETESLAVQHVIELAVKSGCKTYLVHISTADSAIIIADARKKGLNIFAETCPQYLLLDATSYKKPLPEALKYIMSPPLRNESDRNLLWEALAEGNIDLVSTDHCPFMLNGQKDKGLNDFTKVPNGTAGIETRLSLLYTNGVLNGIISMERFVALTSEMAARIFNIYPRKGSLLPGADADIVIWETETEKNITLEMLHQHCDHTLFEGFAVKGGPKMVICNGQIAVEDGKLIDKNLKGRFLSRIVDSS